MREQLWQDSVRDGSFLLHRVSTGQLSWAWGSKMALLTCLGFGAGCWLQCPLHGFSLHVVFHPPGSLSACGLFPSQRQGLFTWWQASKRARRKFQDLLRCRPKINSSNYLPPDFLLREKNKLLNVWTTLVGHSVLWMSNSFRLQH